MSEEESSKAPAQDITSTDTDNDNNGTEDTGPRVFDITPDLNIAPAKDDGESSTPISPINIISQPIVSETNATVTNASVANTVVTNTSATNITPAKSEPVVTKEPVKEQTSFGPANPPAKTVGMNRISQNPNTEQSKPVEPANLQEAVSSIKITEKPVGSIAQNQASRIPEKPWLPKKDAIIKPLRTYETDFAEALARKHITTTSAIIAEENKTTPPRIEEAEQPMSGGKTIIGEVPVAPYQSDNPVPTPPRSSFPIGSQMTRPFYQNQTATAPEVVEKKDIFKNARAPISPKPTNDSHAMRNFLLVIISLILVAGGIYAGYYLYKISPLATMLAPSPVTSNTNLVPTIQETDSFFQTDSKVRLAIDSKNENQIISMLNTEIAKPDQEDKIKEIILTKTKENITTKVTANEILETIKIPVPELITRSLAPDWMLGVYTGIGDQKHVFVITTNTFFQNTFAGIIQWEKTMPEDLKNFTLNPNNNEQTTKGQYKDRIIKNKDVREYVTENGHINYLYSFVSNDKLVITDSEEALDEIIIRLEKKAFVR
jgi:hypothetical protein